MVAKKLIKFIWEYFKVNLSSAMEYRTSFFVQTIFMFLNDVVWVIFWMLFFAKFTSVNSWAFGDLMIMQGIITLSWGISGIFFGNFGKLADLIIEGKLDFYLTLPKEELTHMLVSRAKFDAFGDVLFGLISFIVFLPLTKTPLAILFVLLSTIIILSFGVILGSISFFIGNSSELARTGMMSILSFASYPFSSFTGMTKFVLLTLIPAGFITGVPVELLKRFNIDWFLILLGFTIVFAIVAIVIFKKGVRRYESGNLINVRV
jgi:ABC-2 type transport system permease protein